MYAKESTGAQMDNGPESWTGFSSVTKGLSPELCIEFLKVTVTKENNMTSEGFRIEHTDKLIWLVADFRPFIVKYKI